MIVETLLIAAMTAFHFAIMPGSFGPNLFVEDIVFSTKRIKIVNMFHILAIAEFSSVVCLNDLRRIATAEFAGLTE